MGKGLNVVHNTERVNYYSQLPSELDVKWKMYQCHLLLRQHQEALDTVGMMSNSTVHFTTLLVSLNSSPLLSSSPVSLSD